MHIRVSRFVVHMYIIGCTLMYLNVVHHGNLRCHFSYRCLYVGLNQQSADDVHEEPIRVINTVGTSFWVLFSETVLECGAG